MAKKKPKVRPGRFGISSADVVIARGPDIKKVVKNKRSELKGE